MVVSGKNGNGNKVLSWEWVGMGMGMGTVKVIPAHLYSRPFVADDSARVRDRDDPSNLICFTHLRNAIQRAIYATAMLSVRLTVCVSHS